MRSTRLRRARCEAIADDVWIPRPFDLFAFCDAIAEQRGRSLLVQQMPGGANPAIPCGAWLGMESVDLVYYSPSAEEILPTQIVLHEIAHMLLGHAAPQFDSAADATEAAATADRLTCLMGDTDAVAIIRADAARLRTVSDAQRVRDDELGIHTDRLLSLMTRTSYTTPQEWGAETLATLILERAAHDEVQALSPATEPLLRGLNDVFGHPMGAVRRRRA